MEAQAVGKTVAIAYFLYLYCAYVEANDIDMGMEIILLDQKLSFAKKLGVEKSKSFHYGLNVFSAIEQICADFEQIKLNPDGKIRVIICDEYVSLIDKLSHKDAERLKLLLGSLIFESREYNYHIILAGQAGHAERFSAGVRSSITDKILLGEATATEKSTVFPDDVALMDAHNIAGEGFMKLVGMPYVERFSIRNQVPPFAEIGEKMKKYMLFDDTDEGVATRSESHDTPV